jgi:glucose-1-phosphate thymidylyltransferase
MPAAGRGSRLWPYRYPKELFPVALVPDAGGTGVRPWPVCMYALEAMREAGVDRCVVVVSDEKYEVLRVLGDGTDFGLPCAFVLQREPHGLAHAVRCAQPWIRDANVVLAMPDTVTLPQDALRKMHTLLVDTAADVVMGVFPTEEPERLGPVEMAPDGTVIHVHDKPGHRRWMNAWGLVAWAPSFTEFCCAWDQERHREGVPERVLGHAMEAARASGMSVRALVFEDGVFADIGTPEGLAVTVDLLARRGLTHVPAR